jgi:hypothetical protein
MLAQTSDRLFIPPKEYDYESGTERHSFRSRKS